MSSCSKSNNDLPSITRTDLDSRSVFTAECCTLTWCWTLTASCWKQTGFESLTYDPALVLEAGGCAVIFNFSAHRCTAEGCTLKGGLQAGRSHDGGVVLAIAPHFISISHSFGHRCAAGSRTLKGGVGSRQEPRKRCSASSLPLSVAL